METMLSITTSIRDIFDNDSSNEERLVRLWDLNLAERENRIGTLGVQLYREGMMQPSHCIPDRFLFGDSHRLPPPTRSLRLNGVLRILHEQRNARTNVGSASFFSPGQAGRSGQDARDEETIENEELLQRQRLNNTPSVPSRPSTSSSSSSSRPSASRRSRHSRAIGEFVKNVSESTGISLNRVEAFFKKKYPSLLPDRAVIGEAVNDLILEQESPTTLGSSDYRVGPTAVVIQVLVLTWVQQTSGGWIYDSQNRPIRQHHLCNSMTGNMFYTKSVLDYQIQTVLHGVSGREETTSDSAVALDAVPLCDGLGARGEGPTGSSEDLLCKCYQRTSTNLINHGTIEFSYFYDSLLLLLTINFVVIFLSLLPHSCSP